MKILIVVDMQNDFVDGALGTKEAQAVVDNVVQKIKDFDGDIIATYDTHFKDYLDTREGKYLPVEHCIKNTAGWELNKKVKEALSFKDCVIEIEKETFGAIDLPKILEENYDIDDISIELIGLCTDICVVSNAMILKAAFPQIDIAVDDKCCAGVTVHKHQAALETMRSCQIDVKD